MKVLTRIKEGMWGLVQHRVAQTGSLLRFAAAWSPHTDFQEYGLDFLRAVWATMRTPPYHAWKTALSEACARNSHDDL